MIQFLEYHVLQIFMLILLLNSGQTRILDKEDKLTTNIGNEIDEKTTEKLIDIDLPTSIPPREILKKSIFKDDNVKNPLTDKGVNVKCTDTEINDNTIVDTDEINPCIPEAKDKTEKPLKLSTFIEENRTEEAKNACRVDSSLFLGVESYSGYFTVDEVHDSNMFFWYFPVEKKPLNETPLIIWLQGGPGATSMTGLFDEIGPLTVSSRYNLTKNPNTWLRDHSLLFIDNPVGTGFSFVDEDGYVTDMDTYGKHLYKTVTQFLQVFPELRTAPLFVAGESYAGKYVPALAMEIHKHKKAPGGDINLQGMILGNPYIDPEMLTHVTRPFYYFGLLDNQQINSLKPLLDGFQSDIKANRSVAAKDKWTHIVVLLIMLSHQQHAYNFLRDDLGIGAFHTFLQKPEIKRALHVGDTKFQFISLKVNTKLAPDFLSSSKHMYEELLNEYRVLTYCGQLDQMLPCAHTTEHYRTWRWNLHEEFYNATRLPFMFQGKLAGYYKSGGRLMEVVIRGAGHMVPLDRAAPLRDLVARWVQQQSLGKFFGVLTTSFIEQFVRNNTRVEVMPYL